MMKNVLLIGSELGKGGAERSISLLSYYLEQHYNVTLCILSGKDREQYYQTCKDVVFVDPPEHKGIYGKVKAWQYRLNKVKEIKKQRNIDVSISFLEGPDYVNVLTRGREKVVLSIRGSKMHDKVIAGAKGMLRKKVLIPWLYQKADEIVSVTDALNKELQVHFGIDRSRLKTIYNFYENEKISENTSVPLTADEAAIFSKPVIITSGRLHVAKEHDKLIRILRKIKERADVRLMILGDGDLKKSLISLAEQLGLSVYDWELQTGDRDADVYFMGFQQNAFKFYRHSSLFALASSWEGFPNVLAEALICNIPVISTDCYTGPREILNIGGLGDAPVSEAVRTDVGSLLPLLTEPEEKVINMWRDEALFWLKHEQPSKQGFSALTQRFTKDAMLQAWKEVIE